MQIILNNTNNGFAKANNQGAEIAKGRYFLFMNPDMELLDDTGGKLVSFMDHRQDAAACVSQLIYPDGQRQNNIKRDPTFLSQAIILIKLHHFLKNFQPIRKYLAKDFDYATVQKVEQVMGAFIVIRKEIFNKVGGWSEDYWLWWEDVDLCQRLKNQGQSIYYTPISRIIHHEGQSFTQKLSLQKQKRFNKGMLIYFKKHHHFLAWLGLWLLQPASLFLACLSQLLGIRPRPQGGL